jgi:hypothetical protein
MRSTKNQNQSIPKGTNLVTCVASNSQGAATCSFTVQVKDAEAPVSAVSQARVSGDDIVTTLLASDNCDGSNLLIYVKDSAEGPCGGTFVAGPYPPGTKVRLNRSKQPSVKKASDGIAATISTTGDPLLVVTDSSGNTSCTAVASKCRAALAFRGSRTLKRSRPAFGARKRDCYNLATPRLRIDSEAGRE